MPTCRAELAALGVAPDGALEVTGAVLEAGEVAVTHLRFEEGGGKGRRKGRKERQRDDEQDESDDGRRRASIEW
jgi:hypothetical protein